MTIADWIKSFRCQPMPDAAKTEALYWRVFCERQSHNLAGDPWCRAILTQAALARVPAGRDGYQWTFADRSKLVANSEAVTVL